MLLYGQLHSVALSPVPGKLVSAWDSKLMWVWGVNGYGIERHSGALLILNHQNPWERGGGGQMEGGREERYERREGGGYAYIKAHCSDTVLLATRVVRCTATCVCRYSTDTYSSYGQTTEACPTAGLYRCSGTCSHTRAICVLTSSLTWTHCELDLCTKRKVNFCTDHKVVH